MGFLRGSLVVFLSSLLFLTLLLGNIFLTLSWSMEYETLKPELKEIASEVIESTGALEMIEENYELMEIYCSEYDSFNVSEQGINLSIPCEEIKKGPESVVPYATEEIIEEVYFKNYTCDLFECIKTEGEPYVIVSEKAQEYWHSKYYLALFATIILFGLIFLVIEKKKSAVIIGGILMILAALPFKKINWLLGLLPDGQIASIVSLFFTKAANVFLTMLIIGIIILLVGISLEILTAGLKIGKLFRKKKSKEEETFTKEEVKDIVKKEIKKENKIEKLSNIEEKKESKKSKKN